MLPGSDYVSRVKHQVSNFNLKFSKVYYIIIARAKMQTLSVFETFLGIVEKYEKISTFSFF